MADPLKVPTSKIPELTLAPESHRQARETPPPAPFARRTDPPDVQRALERLDRIVQAGRPLKGNVPRGYYLNIRI